MITAKPVIDEQFWILKEDDRKIGNIQAIDSGYQITINNKIANYKTIPMLVRQEQIEFEEATKPTKQPTNLVHGYSVSGRMFNPLWDVKHKLPLYTKEEKSKSWYAAGWYKVKQHRNWKVIQNPKLISLQRYPYLGPFHNKEEANDKSIS